MKTINTVTLDFEHTDGVRHTHRICMFRGAAGGGKSQLAVSPYFYSGTSTKPMRKQLGQAIKEALK